jgi:hypothetical protein
LEKRERQEKRKRKGKGTPLWSMYAPDYPVQEKRWKKKRGNRK